MVVLPAQSTTKPSVPEFTLKLEAHPYDVPPTYGIDPYTGENVTTQSGYHVENKTIEVTIKNQPFTPYTDTENNTVNLHYLVRVKGHFDDSWVELGHIHSSGSVYTQVSYALGQGALYPILMNVPVRGKLDFQVEALAGYYTPVYHTLYQVGEDFHGETSRWSNTQTITIVESAPTATPTPSPSQSTPTPNESASPSQNPTATLGSSDTQSGVLFGLSGEQIALVVSCISVVVLVVAGLLVYFKKRKR